jgi:predicted O-linked N-acetylglucosamine transferase (SPINDLY family)
MLEHALEALGRGQLAEAEAMLSNLWDQRPDAAVAALQGQVLRAGGRWDEAILWFERALEIDPADARPRLAIGQIRRQQGDAEAARACFEQVVLQAGLALAFAREQPLRLLELGLGYAELDQVSNAIAALQAALALDPTLKPAHESLATLYWQEGLISQAAGHDEAIAQLEPGNVTPRVSLAMRLSQAGDQEGCLEQLVALLKEAPEDHRIREAIVFVASTAGGSWWKLLREVAKDVWQRQGSAARPAFQGLQPAQPQGCLRVGILSAELGNHPVSCFLESFLRHHDRSRFEVELIQTQPRQETRNRVLCDLAHASLLLPQGNAEVSRDLIRERGYQVILETSGFTMASGLPLLAERLAPVQCHYVGFHASTFLPTIDWFIADPVLLPPELEQQFSERIWRLPRPWAAYTPPRALPPVQSLPEGAPPVFGSSNQIAKLGSVTLLHWAAALRAVPEASLLVKHRHAVDPQVQRRIIRTLERAGVAAERVHFEGWAPDWSAHMETYNRIDVALDATPWSSATTAFEALAMGIPLVAIRGDTLAGRMSSAALAGFGESGWIADSPEAFASIAKGLVTDLPALRAGRAERRQRALAGPLFDAIDLAKALETALAAMLDLANQRHG